MKPDPGHIRSVRDRRDQRRLCCGGTTTLWQAVTTFGSPAEPAAADRTIEIATRDSLTFEPAELAVAAGETVTFQIVNNSSLVHDFTLGDQATQDEHEAEMGQAGGMAHDQPNVVTSPATMPAG